MSLPPYVMHMMNFTMLPCCLYHRKTGRSLGTRPPKPYCSFCDLTNITIVLFAMNYTFQPPIEVGRNITYWSLADVELSLWSILGVAVSSHFPHLIVRTIREVVQLERVTQTLPVQGVNKSIIIFIVCVRVCWSRS